MRKGLVFGVAVAGLLFASAAQAQFFGQMGTLGPSMTGSGLEMVGGYLGLASHTVGGTGHLRLAMNNPNYDLGFQGGFAKINNGGASFVGGQVDLKADVVHPVATSPDFHVGGDVAVFVKHQGSGNITPSATRFGFSAVPGVSYRAPAGTGQAVIMWGGFGLDVVRVSYSSSDSSASSTNSSALIALGAGFEFNKQWSVVGEWRHEFATGGAKEFLVGVNYGIGKGAAGAAAPAAK